MLYSRAEFLSWDINYYLFVFTKCKSANMTAVSGSSLGASLDFHATMNLIDALET